MGPLLLIASALLSSYFHAGTSVADAQSLFTIRDITLSIEPRADVTRGTNVSVRCQAVVSSSGHEALSREYTIYKDGVTVYTKTSSSPQDLLYALPDARVSNSGKYKCKIHIGGRQMTSEATRLKVTGLSAPQLRLSNGVVREGEELTARCTAPGETGSIIFYFYENSKEILEERVNADQAEAKLRFGSIGIHKIHCAYTVLVTPDSFKSDDSNAAIVSVKELSVTPVMEVSPRSRIYEGDRLDVSCAVRNLAHGLDNVHLYLSRGTRLLSSGDAKVNHSMAALAEDSGEFECRLEMDNVVKVATKVVSVTELFAPPTLTMAPAEVFQKEFMTLTCRSDGVAAERLRREELTYALDPPGSLSLSPRDTGVFAGKALQYDFNYTCTAAARGIVKRSGVLTVRPKVSVSVPKIRVVGTAVLGRPLRVSCQSDAGSPPINYTLLRDYEPLSTVSVRLPLEPALFTVTVGQPDDINKYMCEARNSHKEPPLSKRLDAAVVVPLSHPTLTVIPILPEIAEGDHLFLICGVRGSPPVTFKWYRVGEQQPLFTTTSDKNNTDYQVQPLAKRHSGAYYCEAVNYANNVVRSEPVTIEVRLALWKKAVIGGFCVLLLLLLLLASVLCYRSKRVTVDKTAVSVWTERPPDAADDEESSVASNGLDVEYTEVVHPQPADPARVPLRKGTDTVYSELQNAPRGAADHQDYGSVEYAELNGEQPSEVNTHQDLPVPAD